MVAARRYCTKDRKRGRLHGLLCVVHEQDHVDFAKPPRHVGGNARRGIWGVAQPLSVNQGKPGSIGCCKLGKEWALNTDAFDKGR